MNPIADLRYVALGLMLALTLASSSTARFPADPVVSEAACSDEEFRRSVDQIDLPSGYLRIWDGQAAEIRSAERVRGSCAKAVHSFFTSGIKLRDGRVFGPSVDGYRRWDPNFRGEGAFPREIRLGRVTTLSPYFPEKADETQQVFVRSQAGGTYEISEAVVFRGKVTLAPPLFKLADRVVAITELPALHGTARTLIFTVERGDEVIGLTWASWPKSVAPPYRLWVK